MFREKRRWPIKYQEQIFPDRLSLLVYIITIRNNRFPQVAFLHSNHYFMRAALESKFQRSFPQNEIKELMKDKTWQTHTSAPQLRNNLKGAQGC